MGTWKKEIRFWWKSNLDHLPLLSVFLSKISLAGFGELIKLRRELANFQPTFVDQVRQFFNWLKFRLLSKQTVIIVNSTLALG